MRDNTQEVKDMIVSTYKRGVCDKDGVTLPKSQWGRSGKGSAFMGSFYNDKFRNNFDNIDWSKK